MEQNKQMNRKAKSKRKEQETHEGNVKHRIYLCIITSDFVILNNVYVGWEKNAQRKYHGPNKPTENIDEFILYMPSIPRNEAVS